MFNTVLYTFEKKRNSTARPASGGTTFQGEIKGDFTPLAFSLVFKFSNAAQIPPYNYAYVADFSRYYYITDWVFVGGLWRGAFTVDVLATYKTEILNTTQFVARAADATPRGIIDTAYCIEGGSKMATTDQTMTPTEFWGSDFANGVVVAGIISASGKNLGALTYYAFSADGFSYLMGKMLDDISWANISITEISEELQKALINPVQYIASAIWLPVNDINFITNWGAPGADIVTSVKLGWWNFSLGYYSARILHNPMTVWDYFTRKVYFDLDKHPQSIATPGHLARPWLELSPYSRYNLTFLPFGSFDLDTTELYGYSHLGVQVRVHAYTGDATLTISVARDDQGTAEKVIQVFNANCGIPLPLGQISINMGNLDSALQSAAIMGATEIAQNLATPTVSTSQPATQTGGARSGPSPKSKTSRKSSLISGAV